VLAIINVLSVAKRFATLERVLILALAATCLWLFLGLSAQKTRVSSLRADVAELRQTVVHLEHREARCLNEKDFLISDQAVLMTAVDSLRETLLREMERARDLERKLAKKDDVITKIVEVPVETVKGVIDEESSRSVADFINADIFSH
jgi:hypothetical protein